MTSVTVPKVIENLKSVMCGCGNPATAWKVLHDHLIREAIEIGKRPPLPNPVSGEWYIVAYLLDYAGATEHGSSVLSAWITDDGREALEFLEQYGDGWTDTDGVEFYDSEGAFIGGQID